MRFRRHAAAACAAAVLAPTAALAAPAAFVIPAAPSRYATPFNAGHDGFFESSATIDPGGTAHLAWTATDEKSVVSCSIPLGKRSCSPQVTLPLFNPIDSTSGRLIVLSPAPNTVEILSYECCYNGQVLQITAWTSTDDGNTFGPPTELGTLNGLDAAVTEGSQTVLLGEEHDGLHQQVVTAGTPATTDSVISPDHYDAKAAVLPGGALLIGHDDFTSGSPYTTTVQLESAPGAAASTVATFPGESIDSLVTGPSGTFLMTRVDNQGATLDPPVRIRQWNGTSFNSAHVLPVPGAGDDGRFNLGIDGLGHLHVVWQGAREDYRLWHSVSTDGAKTWHASLLGDSINAAEEYPLLDAVGAGVALETTTSGGGGPVVVQPLLVTPTVTLAVKKGALTGKVSPAVKNRLVDLQVLSGKHWKTLAKAREDGHGAFNLHSIKKATYRAYVDGQFGTYDIGTSNSVKVKAA